MNGLRVPGADGSTREIDHVAVGPGGVLVVQTKLWPSKARQIDVSGSPAISSAAIDAQQQAAVVRWFLGDLVDSPAVSASLVLWGIGTGVGLRPGCVFDRRGVHIVHGRDAAPWRTKMAAIEHLNDVTIVTVLEKLQPCLIANQRLRDAKPPANEPTTRYWRARRHGNKGIRGYPRILWLTARLSYVHGRPCTTRGKSTEPPKRHPFRRGVGSTTCRSC